MKLEQSLSFAAASLMFAGCFAPDGEVVSSTGGTAETGSGGGETEDTTPATTDQPTGGMTTGNPSSGTTMGEPTTGNPTTDEPTTDDSSDPTSGGEDPFCGDGNVDAGEECDDGLENNGLEQGCLPDCNLNICGDSNIGPDELCDDGEGDNVLLPGACAPDCSGVIEEKIISFSGVTEGGNYEPNPVGYADGRCAAGSRALFAVPGLRQATNGTPNSADATVDWPLSPYTAYTRADGSLIWVTDDVPLLGVRAGSPQPLEQAIRAECVSEFCAFNNTQIVTGLNPNWTTATSDTCNGWISTSEDVDFAVGASLSDTEFLDSNDHVACSFGASSVFGGTPRFYCVEQ